MWVLDLYAQYYLVILSIDAWLICFTPSHLFYWIYIYMYWVYFCFINQENYNHVSFETFNDLLQCRMYFQAQFVLSCQKEIYLKYGFFFFSFFLLDLFALLSVYHKSFIFLKKHNAVYFISVSSVCSLNLDLEKIFFFLSI